jgi:UDP-glucuronate 4-epimerase
MQSNWADVSKAREMLGWQPQVSLHDGMQSLVNWYNAERSWADKVLTP